MDMQPQQEPTLREVLLHQMYMRQDVSELTKSVDEIVKSVASLDARTKRIENIVDTTKTIFNTVSKYGGRIMVVVVPIIGTAIARILEWI